MQFAFITHARLTKPHELRAVRINNNYSVFCVTLYSDLLGCYTVSSGNSLPTFQENLSVLKMGPIGCPETSARNYHYSLDRDTEERSSHLLRSGRLKLLNTGVQHVCVRFHIGLQHVYFRFYTGLQHVYGRFYSGLQHVYVRFYIGLQHVYVRFYSGLQHVYVRFYIGLQHVYVRFYTGL